MTQEESAQPPKVFTGTRESGSCVVHVSGGGTRRKELPLRLNVFNHSPSGFEWGYGGSGPAQLALAMLIEAFPDKSSDWVVRVHQAFKFKVVGSLSRDRWSMTIAEVRRIAEELAVKLGVEHGDSPQDA